MEKGIQADTGAFALIRHLSRFRNIPGKNLYMLQHAYSKVAPVRPEEVRVPLVGEIVTL